MNNSVHPYSPVCSYYDKSFSKDYLNYYPLSFVIINNGIVLPIKTIVSAISDKFPKHSYHGGVVDETGNYIPLSAYRSRPIGSYAYDKQDLLISDKKIIYMGYFHNQWGHLLIDGMARLWYLNKNYINDYYLCFVGLNRLNNNSLQLLKMFGISEDRILFVAKPTQFKKIIVPERAFNPGVFYSQEYIGMFDKIIDALPPCKCGSHNLKVYFSRKKLKGIWHVEIGHGCIEKFFKKNGFKIVYPEKCSVDEQIAYIQNCEMFVSTDGTIAHNLVFAKPGTKVVILNRFNFPNVHQYLINQMRNLSVVYVDICLALFPSNRTSILYYSDEFKEWAKANGYILPKIAFFKLKIVFSLVIYLLQYLRENHKIPVHESLEDLEYFYVLYRERLGKLFPFRLFQ